MARSRRRRRGEARRRDADADVERAGREAAAPDGARRDARRRAERKVALVGELLRFALVCGLLLVFVPPVGVVVAFFWGLGLAKRTWAELAAPALRERWTEGAPARDAGGRAAAGDGPAAARPALRDVPLADLVEAALAARSARVDAPGVELRRAIDAPGAVRADPELLGRAVGALLDRALAALAEGGAPARLDVAAGENLAGTQAWLRILARAEPLPGARRGAAGAELERDLAPARRIVEAHAGTLEAHAAPGAGLELLVTLPKGAGGDAG
jgi:signal transduction histidine kinase